MRREVLSMLGVAMKDFSRNNCSYIAAGIAYWTLFSLFPLAMAAISILGFAYSAPEDQGRIVERGIHADLIATNIANPSFISARRREARSKHNCSGNGYPCSAMRNLCVRSIRFAI